MQSDVNSTVQNADKKAGGGRRAARGLILGLALALATTLGGCYLDVYDHHGHNDHHDHHGHHDHHDHHDHD